MHEYILEESTATLELCDKLAAVLWDEHLIVPLRPAKINQDVGLPVLTELNRLKYRTEQMNLPSYCLCRERLVCRYVMPVAFNCS